MPVIPAWSRRVKTGRSRGSLAGQDSLDKLEHDILSQKTQQKGLERGLGGLEHILLLWGSELNSQVPIRQFTITCNPMKLSRGTHIHMTYTHRHTHTYIKNIIIFFFLSDWRYILMSIFGIHWGMHRWVYYPHHSQFTHRARGEGDRKTERHTEREAHRERSLVYTLYVYLSSEGGKVTTYSRSMTFHR